MKKVLVLLLLFIVACGGSGEETVSEDTTTTVRDTTTTTIPPAPTVDFNIVEIYNTKLGTELCSDAKEIDTTSEPCLKQYRDNLENVFSYAENLQKYITELNTYLEAYPSEMTEEYTTLFQFVNDEYQVVPEIYGIVANKYIDRFGGVPELLNFSFSENISVGCPAEFNYLYTENLQSGNLTFKNNSNEKIVVNIKNGENISNLEMLNSGSTFEFYEGKLVNFLGEVYQVNLDDSFYVSTTNLRIIKVEFDKTNIKYGEEFNLKIEYEHPEFASLINNINETYIVSVQLRSLNGDYTETLSFEYPLEYPLNYGNSDKSYIDLEKNIININAKYFNENKINSINFNPIASPYFISWMWVASTVQNSNGVVLEVNKPGSSHNASNQDEPYELFGEMNSWGLIKDIRSDCSILQWKISVPIFYNNSLTFEK